MAVRLGVAAQKQPRTLAPPPAPVSASSYEAVRRFSESLCKPLVTEDFVIQSMPDVSPTRWHLAHTTWFFETLVLSKYVPNYRPYHRDFVYLFNSYYNSIGEQFPRSNRGLLSRPTVKDIFDYRAYVDEHMRRLLARGDAGESSELASVIQIGLNHEQQHQELILTDIKHVFSCNPLYPVYRAADPAPGRSIAPLQWMSFEEGPRSIGSIGEGFSYDNEHPRHQVHVHAFKLATRLITNAEYLEFIEDGGYDRPEFWLSEGWSTVREQGWRAPLYWEKREESWWNFTLSGIRPIDSAEPVCHVSYFEADAFARWAGAALPFEWAWEVASETAQIEGNFAESARFHPAPGPDADAQEGRPSGLAQMFGDVWEWTCSPYMAYPGYRPVPGPLGEYNAKFMCNQMVLRGGSCATSRSHVRRTYRNFFPPAARWQFTGIRLAQ